MCSLPPYLTHLVICRPPSLNVWLNALNKYRRIFLMPTYVRKESKGLHKGSGLVSGGSWDCGICPPLLHSTLIGPDFSSTSISVISNVHCLLDSDLDPWNQISEMHASILYMQVLRLPVRKIDKATDRLLINMSSHETVLII